MLGERFLSFTQTVSRSERHSIGSRLYRAQPQLIGVRRQAKLVRRPIPQATEKGFHPAYLIKLAHVYANFNKIHAHVGEC